MSFGTTFMGSMETDRRKAASLGYQARVSAESLEL